MVVCLSLVLPVGSACATSAKAVEPGPTADALPATDDNSALDAQAAIPATVIDRSPLSDLTQSSDIAPERFLFFAGLDLWGKGGSVHGGALWAPKGLAQDGFIMKLLTGGGSYQYISNGRIIRGRHTFNAVMPGYRFSGHGFEARLFAGIDFQQHWLSPADPANRLRGSHTGVRVNGELWWEPLPATMLSSSFSVSSIGPNYSLRGAAGWKLFDSFYIGPEAETFSDLRYRQYRIGAHVTALRTGNVEWTAGVGYAQDSSNGSGVYGRLGFLVRR